MVYPRVNPANDEDPELAAEQAIEAQNGIISGASKKESKSIDTPKADGDSEEGKATTPTSAKNSFKEAKASRKKRSRGISGSSIKKDGGKFDLGMENFDTFDDVSEQEDADDYRSYEKYLSDHYSSHSNDPESESESGSHLSENRKKNGRTNPQVSGVVSALLAFISDPAGGTLSTVAELLMEEYDEAGRSRILELALDSITKDLCGVVSSDVQCEYHLVAAIARLIDEGLLNKANVAAYVENSPNDGLPIRLLSSALQFASDALPELRGDLQLKPPQSVSRLARDLCQESDVCGVASSLSDLQLPYYHSYFVHQVCVEAVNTVNMNSIFYVTGALRDMLDHQTLTVSSVHIGFARFFQGIQELEVDLPGATSLGRLLVSYAANDNNLIDEDLCAKCPKPKRFLLNKADSCGKLTVLGMKEADVQCDENNYFIMEE